MKTVYSRILSCLIGITVVFAAEAQNKSGYVIAVEGNDVYIDQSGEGCKPGDIFEVYSKPGYFVHPVTKKRIKKERKLVSTLVVKEVEASYSLGRAIPPQTLSAIEEGMPVGKTELDSTGVDGHIVWIEDTDVYTCRGSYEVSVGDSLKVYSLPGYFIHPVTKKQIAKEPEQIATLEVIEVEPDYAHARLLGEPLSALKRGMPLRLARKRSVEPTVLAISGGAAWSSDESFKKKVNSIGNSSSIFLTTIPGRSPEEEIRVKGLRLYMGNDKLGKRNFENVYIDGRFLEDIYSRARTKEVFSWISFGWGASLIVGGVIGASLSPAVAPVIGCGVIGVGLSVGGIILRSSAKKDLQNIARMYNHEVQTRQESAELSFVVPETGGLGLRLTF